MNRVKFTSKLMTLVALMCLAGACSQPLTVEQEVIAAIREMEASIESGERDDFIARVDENFIGQEPVMTRDQLKAFIIFQLYRNEQVQVQFMPIHVTSPEANEAKANFNVLLTGGQGRLPDSGQLLSFETLWHRQDEVWLLRSASWAPVTIDPSPQ